MTSDERPVHVLILVAVIALGVAVHAGALGTYFARDDITFLLRAARHVPPSGLARLLSAGLGISAEHALFGLSPLGYHVVNLALHALNTLGVYALALRWTRHPMTARLAAIAFATSSIAFTPLHWVTGIVELLTTALLLGATLVHLRPTANGSLRVLATTSLLLAALLSKETALPWLAVMVAADLLSGRAIRLGTLVPAGIVTASFAGYLAGGMGLDTTRDGAYAMTSSPRFLLTNLTTYAAWNLAAWNPIPDRIAAADPASWRIAAPIAVVLGWLASRLPPPRRIPVHVGLVWWLAFLLPVLPLEHHTYYYYLYLPWAGGSIALAALLTATFESWSVRRGSLACAMFATIAVALQWRNVSYRSGAVDDALPVDGVLRDAELIHHAILSLRAANLPDRTLVGFVNPVPRAPAMSAAARDSLDERSGEVRTYVPLQAALRDGETLALLVPGVVYRGFATTIPPDWPAVECFHYEQRGWLERWGKGAQALRFQARVQRSAGRSLAADSTERRIRALEDSLPGRDGRPLTASSRSR